MEQGRQTIVGVRKGVVGSSSRLINENQEWRQKKSKTDHRANLVGLQNEVEEIGRFGCAGVRDCLGPERDESGESLFDDSRKDLGCLVRSVPFTRIKRSSDIK